MHFIKLHRKHNKIDTILFSTNNIKGQNYDNYADFGLDYQIPAFESWESLPESTGNYNIYVQKTSTNIHKYIHAYF